MIMREGDGGSFAPKFAVDLYLASMCCMVVLMPG